MKNVFRVVKRPDGMWYGIKDGRTDTIVVTHIRELAAAEVVEHARDAGDARVLVFNTDGECIEERTFAEARKRDRGASWDEV